VINGLTHPLTFLIPRSLSSSRPLKSFVMILSNVESFLLGLVRSFTSAFELSPRQCTQRKEMQNMTHFVLSRKVTTSDECCENNYKTYSPLYRAWELLSVQQQQLPHWCVCVPLPANVGHTTNGQIQCLALPQSCTLASCSSFETDGAAYDMSNEHRSRHLDLRQSQLQHHNRQFTNVWHRQTTVIRKGTTARTK